MANSSWRQAQYTPLQRHSVSKAFNLLWLIKLKLNPINAENSYQTFIGYFNASTAKQGLNKLNIRKNCTTIDCF